MTWLDSASESVVVAGARVCYRRLGTPGRAPIVLVHGGAAHAGWWLHVVPALTADHEVVVIELSGHGDSDHRAQYPPLRWAEEIVAVLRHIDAGPAHLVGHSMGGMVAMLVAGRHREWVRTLLVVDSVVIHRPVSRRRWTPATLYYPTQAEGLANFRLRPRGTIADPTTLDLVARAGLREDAEGWRWKFDPQAIRPLPRDELDVTIPEIRCPVHFLYGEHSELVDRETVDHLSVLLGRDVPARIARGAYHHVPIDAPGATVSAIEHLIGTAADLPQL